MVPYPLKKKQVFYNVVLRQFISNPTQCCIYVKFGHTETKSLDIVEKQNMMGQNAGSVKCVNYSVYYYSKNFSVFIKEKQLKSFRKLKKLHILPQKQ